MVKQVEISPLCNMRKVEQGMLVRCRSYDCQCIWHHEEDEEGEWLHRFIGNAYRLKNEPILSDFDLQGRGIWICSVLFLESPLLEIDGLRRSRVGSKMREIGVSHRLVLVCVFELSCIAPVCCSWICMS